MLISVLRLLSKATPECMIYVIFHVIFIDITLMKLKSQEIWKSSIWFVCWIFSSDFHGKGSKQRKESRYHVLLIVKHVHGLGILWRKMWRNYYLEGILL